MKNAILDSSSAILIYKSNVFKSLPDYCNIVIPETVFSELAVSGYEGADYFTGLCLSGRIKVLKQQSDAGDRIGGKIHHGERSVITLFHEGRGDFVIIDDGKGAAYCRGKGIPYINALLAVKIMFLNGIIPENEYSNAWRWLLANGRYSEEVIEWADNADRDQLAVFI